MGFNPIGLIAMGWIPIGFGVTAGRLMKGIGVGFEVGFLMVGFGVGLFVEDGSLGSLQPAEGQAP